MRKQTFIALFVIMALALGACGAASRSSIEEVGAPAMDFGGQADGIARAPEMESAVAYEQPMPADDFGNAEERLVIRNASLSIVVLDPAESLDAIASMAEAMGGFVVSSNLYQTTFAEGVVADSGYITIRVPSGSLDDAIDIIKGDASEVRSQSISGEDVTDEYTDLSSKLRNLEAAEEELLEIMETAYDADDVLAIFEHLRQIREEIEVTRGRMQYYEQSARLSSISVDLIPHVAAQPLTIGKWEPQGTAKAAIQALLNALKFIGNAVIWIIIFVAPVVFVLALPIVLIVRAIRKRRAKKKNALPPDES